MKLYRIERHFEDGSVSGYEWFTSIMAAMREVRMSQRGLGLRDPRVTTISDPIEVRVTKHGVLALLNTYATHPDSSGVRPRQWLRNKHRTGSEMGEHDPLLPRPLFEVFT
jgi:hypothetical protein